MSQLARNLGLLFALLWASSVWTLPGCGPAEEPAGEAGPADSATGSAAQGDAANSFDIAVIPKGTTHEFWKSVHAGAVKAERELEEDAGLSIQLNWNGPQKEDDRESQIKVVENFISRQVDGIVLAPLDDKALRRPVLDATRAGIPVVIIDSGLDSQQHISFVATDNYKGGQLAGEHMAKLLDGAGDIVVLRYQEGSASTQNREQGFLDAVAEHPDINVVSDNQYGGATTETAYAASENLLAPLQTGERQLRIDGIFCPNESTTFGMLRALEDARLTGTVRFVGFDASEKLVQALVEQKIDALVVQNPLRMGYLGVKTLVDYLQGRNVPKRVDTGVSLVTPDNMNDDEMQDLLNPPFDEYLAE